MAVDGDMMGGMDGGGGCGSISSEYAVSKNGRRESGGGDQKMAVLSKCQFSFSSGLGINWISRSQISSRQ